MKLCKDCRWFGGGEFFAECRHRRARRPLLPDYVHGSATLEEYELCRGMRYGRCGPEGKLWEPKEE